MSALTKYWIAFKRIALAFAVLILIIGVLHFPYDVDAPISTQEIETTRKYYADAYRKPVVESQPSAAETEYVQAAEIEARTFGIENQVRTFVDRFNLRDKAVLEIGSGRGYLQDIVENYTGLDISQTVARFYHKKFVLGSATAMPFADDSFDAVWSIWVFEHVSNPEQAFYEARRVVKHGGVIFLYPGWMSPPWAAEGYAVRPFSDFGLGGKLIKASIPFRSSIPFRAMSLIPIRVMREAAAVLGPTRLRYRRLTPNYDTYWVQDSDAVNSIDSHEGMLWFTSRGDQCLNCDGAALLMGYQPLIIRVDKSKKGQRGRYEIGSGPSGANSK